ncbi:unnamed protein product [Vitrella brassicaformis CCMP3155]|uniref:CBM20 domain-containing protein n=1 Tax=Vitrella brassicaformis (strain CCMP3155) TaxID=1169540 RepID=A0A0G4FD92_VITBC|nr:unnamed protein product [Vitrella brassicaformis CCMP3155]|eukprot:CEM11132.1 unnamed protein product [Vitrella brassicaformis CCMP3155]
MAQAVFECHCERTKPGDELCLIGGVGELGNWDVGKALPLNGATYPIWRSARVGLPAQHKIEFKFVLRLGHGGQDWERFGGNREVTLSNGEVTIKCAFDKKGDQSVVSGTAAAGGLGSSSASTASGQTGSASPGSPSADGGGGVGVGVSGGFPPPISAADIAAEAQKSFTNAWLGREVQFARSRSGIHRDRQQQWDVTHLSGSARQLVEGDKKAGSWRNKLGVVKEVVENLHVSPKEDNAQGDLAAHALVDVSIYLNFIQTGIVQCVEDGGHHRPNHHANLSKVVFTVLERILLDLSRRDDTQADTLRVVMRKVHPNLPAFTSEFTASVPLTRIRDIAHRNDIPHDLKQELKHTLQNKLHRCAGPEDLVATEKMLQRFHSNRHQYPGGFIQDGLLERLDKLQGTLDGRTLEMLKRFCDSKTRSDRPDANFATLLVNLKVATELRMALVRQVQEAGIPIDNEVAMLQQKRLAEIDLERAAFVLLSRIEQKANEEERWGDTLEALSWGVRHVQLNGMRRDECMAIYKELTHQPRRSLQTREEQLLLKATLERTRRLAEAYCDLVLSIYPPRVQDLGRAFGAPHHAIQVFAEADIRANVTFQVSKLSTLLLKRLRRLLEQRGFDPIVAGTTCGTLVDVSSLEPSKWPDPEGGPYVMLVRAATGDEEIGGVGDSNVHAIILGHDLPHLSHLGVRARQEGVVFVTCEDSDEVKGVAALKGKIVRVEASSQGVEVYEVDEAAMRQLFVRKYSGIIRDIDSPRHCLSKHDLQPPGSAPEVRLSDGSYVIDVEHVTKEEGGSKSAVCGMLARLSNEAVNVEDHDATFKTPKGAVIPFGTMEAVMCTTDGERQLFQKLYTALDAANLKGKELDECCQEMQDAIESLPLDTRVIAQLQDRFTSDSRLIVRSSANVEDLAGMSAAGLYDSIPNVNCHCVDKFSSAVRGVWKSLFSRRAHEAHMAVLVQELLTPSHSFVLHTVNPLSKDKEELYAEIAPGLGETLASGAVRGTPYRLVVNKRTGEVRILSFASYSYAQVPVLPRKRSFSAIGEAIEDVKDQEPDTLVKKVVIDYTQDVLVTDPSFREAFARRLGAIGSFLESKLGGPQDVEGCIVDTTIYVVQSRPQP